MKQFISTTSGRMQQAALAILLGLAVAQPARSQTSPLYENDDIVNCPPETPPMVDATTFINTGSFNINETLGSPGYYVTANTLNYTNTGTMTSLGGFDFELYPDIGGKKPAANFANTGTVGDSSGGIIRVAATNVISSGTFNVGGSSLLKLTGSSMDLSWGTMAMAGVSGSFGYSGIFSQDYGLGVDTNADWYPSFALTRTTAYSSFFTNHLGRFVTQMYLTNSTPYVVAVTNGSSNVIVRAVFVQNLVPGVTNRVYIDTNEFDMDYGTVEWAGAYVDPSTDQLKTNYFYLDDIFTYTTNSYVFGGIPDGFSFAQNVGTPLFTGTPTTNGLTNGIFPNGVVINNSYSYVRVLVSASTVTTNNIGGMTNMAGRIELSASGHLNLSHTRISGPNYLSVQATNQYDGNVGAQISSPYSDINLRETNTGFLTVSNLLTPAIPVWNGTVEAWNTRWSTVVGAVTNDYCVLLVKSQLTPTTTAEVQDLTLRAANSVVISDQLNVIRTLFIDTKSLTLTTNPAHFFTGNGKLNLESKGITWSTALPNLINLTNDGTIQAQNGMFFGGARTNSFFSVSPSDWYATMINDGVIYDQGTHIWANYFENSGLISCGSNSFALQCVSGVMTNGAILATNGDIAITAVSLVTSNLVLQAGRTLTLTVTNQPLTVTNQLTDNGVTNGNSWSAGRGVYLPFLPPIASLLGTTITSTVPYNQQSPFVWAGQDRGATVSGFSNNAAIGRLVLDSLGLSNVVGSSSQFTFSGPGVSNALYVDRLELLDYATNRDGSGNFTALNVGTNFVIYYAQALMNGVSIAEKMNHKNNDQLRWVAAYAGYFSSTNLVYDGTTNTVNAVLVQSTSIDSNGDGTPNAYDPTPFFEPAQVDFTATLTNVPPLSLQLCWHSIPAATNHVLFKTNLLSPNWQVLTNFVSPGIVPPLNGWPLTNTVLDVVNQHQQKYFRVLVDPNTATLYGP